MKYLREGVRLVDVSVAGGEREGGREGGSVWRCRREMWQVCGWGRFDMCVRRGRVCVCVLLGGERVDKCSLHTQHTHIHTGVSQWHPLQVSCDGWSPRTVYPPYRCRPPLLLPLC